MSIELRTGRNGKLRSTWYGRYEVNGKRHTINLGVKIAGTPPKSLSLREEGDKAFERSRAQATERLDQTIAEARRKHDSAHLVKRIYEIKTGEQIKSVALDDLPDEWLRIPRRRKPNERYAAQCRSTLARFAVYVRAQNPKAEEISHVTRDMARAFMAAEDARGVTAKTWNDTLKLLRASYQYLLPAGSINPFSSLPTREIENSDGITWRVRKVLAAAGFKDAEENVDTDQTDDTEVVRGEIHAERKDGLRRASVRDFHSCRLPFRADPFWTGSASRSSRLPSPAYWAGTVRARPPCST